jgi:hypothetical protein
MDCEYCIVAVRAIGLSVVISKDPPRAIDAVAPSRSSHSVWTASVLQWRDRTAAEPYHTAAMLSTRYIQAKIRLETSL